MKGLNILSGTGVGFLESLPATKNHQGGLGDSKDESDARTFSVPDSETGEQSAPQIQLDLMPKQPQQAKANADRVLAENNLDPDNVCHMAIKVFAVFLQLKCASAQL